VGWVVVVTFATDLIEHLWYRHQDMRLLEHLVDCRLSTAANAGGAARARSSTDAARSVWVRRMGALPRGS
jgi:hypothetical protein